MSAKIIEAFEQEAHRLDAEADNAGDGDSGTVKARVQRELAQVLRNLAHRSQGTDPAAVAAEEQAAGDGGGLTVTRTVSETEGSSGTQQVVAAPQAPSQPAAQDSPGIP